MPAAHRTASEEARPCLQAERYVGVDWACGLAARKAEGCVDCGPAQGEVVGAGEGVVVTDLGAGVVGVVDVASAEDAAAEAEEECLRDLAAEERDQKLWGRADEADGPCAAAADGSNVPEERDGGRRDVDGGDGVGKGSVSSCAPEGWRRGWAAMGHSRARCCSASKVKGGGRPVRRGAYPCHRARRRRAGRSWASV